MFIPLYDSNSLRNIRRQYVTIGLILVNVLVFCFTSLSTEDVQTAAVLGLGFIPSVVHDLAVLPPQYDLIPPDLSYLSYAFLHGSWLHLLGNMLFLWVFGDNVEDALGHVRFLIFYLLCAAAGAFAHGWADPQSQVPLVGASGAIAGIVAAYLMLHPRVKIWVLAFARIPLRLPAWFVLAAWIVMQFAMFAFFSEDEVSWAAHIGGILAGAVLVVFMRRRGVPLFDRGAVVIAPAAAGR